MTNVSQVRASDLACTGRTHRQKTEPRVADHISMGASTTPRIDEEDESAKKIARRNRPSYLLMRYGERALSD